MSTEEKNGYVYRAILKQETLESVLKTHFNGAHAIVRRVDCTSVKTYEEVLSGLDQWAEGQIFNDKAELRWRKTDKDYNMTLLLTEEDNPPDPFPADRRLSFTVVCPSLDKNHGFLLWGTRQDQDTGTFWEARIPRPLCYSLKTKGKPPQLAYRLYQDGEAVRWVRLVDLVEAK